MFRHNDLSQKPPRDPHFSERLKRSSTFGTHYKNLKKLTNTKLLLNFLISLQPFTETKYLWYNNSSPKNTSVSRFRAWAAGMQRTGQYRSALYCASAAQALQLQRRELSNGRNPFSDNWVGSFVSRAGLEASSRDYVSSTNAVLCPTTRSEAVTTVVPCERSSWAVHCELALVYQECLACTWTVIAQLACARNPGMEGRHSVFDKRQQLLLLWLHSVVVKFFWRLVVMLQSSLPGRTDLNEQHRKSKPAATKNHFTAQFEKFVSENGRSRANVFCHWRGN